MDMSQTVHQSAQEVIAARPTSLADALNTFVGTFVGWPFTAAPGFVEDYDGNRSDVFACVIHTTPAAKGGPVGLPADGVAAVIDASENLGIEDLREAYARIAHAAAEEKADLQSARRSADDHGNTRDRAGTAIRPATRNSRRGT